MAHWTDLAPWHGTTHHGAAMTGHRGLVVHIAAGYYEGTISWQSKDLDVMHRLGESPTSSHWIVGRKPGERIQMVDTDVQAWAQRSGNAAWLSVEMAGFAGDALTAWQIEFCAQLLARAHQVYGVPLQVATSPSGRGLGHHSMGAPDWGHAACPGPKIIAQKPAIVARAKQLTEGDDMTTIAEIKTLLMTDKQLRASLAVLPWQADIIPRGVPADNPNPTMTTGFTLGFILTVIGRLTPRLDEILAAAQDDGNTNVVLDPASLVALQELRDSIAGVPAAVAGEQAKRLAS